MHALLFSNALVTAKALGEAQSMKHSGRSSMGRSAGALAVGCQSDASIEPQRLRRRQKGRGSRGARLTAACTRERVSSAVVWRATYPAR
eukprot:203239-Pyramimonas_sp.AAC.1